MRRLILLLALSLTLPPRPAAAQGFDHPVRLIVPFAPGGTSDILARLLAPELSRAFGQNVVVENRTGAAGNIGADTVAKAPPDGHTLLLIDAGILATAPALFARLPFDPQRDLAPVSMLLYAPYVLAVHPSVPATDAASLLAWAKANPERLTNANSGVGAANHLTSALLAAAWGVQVIQVPYRGGAAALASAANGESNSIINGATATLPFVQDGRLRAIAVSGPHRLESLPTVPTFTELGWPAPQSGTYQGLLAPGGTPAPMLARIERDVRAALAQPELARRISDLGGEVRAEGGAAFRAWLANEIATWGQVVRTQDIRLD